MTVDVNTGEIVPVDKSSAASVITYLENARSFLATAVDVTGPEQIAMAKAQIATAAEATKQLNLSKEIQLDAQEMVRRAEYALGKSIRKGQAEGSIAKRGDKGGTGSSGHLGGVPGSSRGEHLGTPHEIAGEHKSVLSEIYEMVDGASDEEFDSAIGEAKSEGQLTRANVVRKVKGQKSGETRQQRADKIRKLAGQGYTRQQIAHEVDITEGAVAVICKDFDITIGADLARGKRRRLDSTQVLTNIAASIETAVFGIQQIDPQDLGEESQELVDSLTKSIKALGREVKKIKESL